ncbi:methyl-accepting chemotaxis protein [Comamonas composti]|uniref:methyl-accepting chemotaxis protein n=1 Tax=Comamonas composti TaxID=408558 RepID=UPI00042733EB|nr:methyl-accepting chemotaxis protein [Comamonas composti]
MSLPRSSGFGNLHIGLRIGLAFALTIALSAIVTVLAVLALIKVTASLHLVTQDYYIKVHTLHQIASEVGKQGLLVRNLFIFDDPIQHQQDLKGIEDSYTTIEPMYTRLSLTIHAPTGQKLMHELLQQRDIYVHTLNHLLELLGQGEGAQARRLLEGDLRLHQQAYVDGMNRLIKFEEDLTSSASDFAENQVRLGMVLVVSAGGACTLLSILLGWLLTRSITAPLRQAVHIAETVAAGDLSTQITVVRKDEAGRLLSALGSMNASLVRIVGDVRSASAGIATEAAQIANDNAQLSLRTEEQASSLQETSASMEELTSTVQQNADSAKQAQQLAHQASEVASLSATAVGSVVNTMSGIQDSSERMADIISVINDIAFQTNLLALNAAVEAARAGEQGRGFAVVASEVRNLAQRCAAAAKEVKALIETGIRHVGMGNTHVGQTQHTIRDLVTQITQVANFITQISEASLHQASGIHQVGNAMQELDQTTQQNAALVEERASAAESLHQKAEALMQIVSQFRLPGHDALAAVSFTGRPDAGP